jgi:GTP-binding protein
MGLFDPGLAAKGRVVAISKLDLPEVRGLVEGVRSALAQEGVPVLAFSAVSGEGLDNLVGELARHLREHRQATKP